MSKRTLTAEAQLTQEDLEIEMGKVLFAFLFACAKSRQCGDMRVGLEIDGQGMVELNVHVCAKPDEAEKVKH